MICLLNKRIKKAQVTFFIILSILIVAAIVAIAMVFISIGKKPAPHLNPMDVIKTCLKDEFGRSIPPILMQGGINLPEKYILFDFKEVEFLCYAEKEMQTCTIRHPLLKRFIEEEIKNKTQQKL